MHNQIAPDVLEQSEMYPENWDQQPQRTSTMIRL